MDHEWLLKALREFQIPVELMRIIEGLYKNPEFYVEVDGIQSSKAKQETGVRQGCPLSPYLFILLMDRIFEMIPVIAKDYERSMKTPKVKKPSMKLSFMSLLYADDTLLGVNQEEITESLLWAIEDISGVFGLKLNRKKCQQISN